MPRRPWRVPPQASLRLEQLLVCLVRWWGRRGGHGVAGAASPRRPAGCGVYFVAVSAWAHRALADAPDDRRPFLWTSVADAVGCLLCSRCRRRARRLRPHLVSAAAFELGLSLVAHGGVGAAGGLDGDPVRLSCRRVRHDAPRLADPGDDRSDRCPARARWSPAQPGPCLATGRGGPTSAGRPAAGNGSTALDEVEISTSPQQRADLLALVEQACARPELGSEITRRLAKALVRPPTPGHCRRGRRRSSSWSRAAGPTVTSPPGSSCRGGPCACTSRTSCGSSRCPTGPRRWPGTASDTRRRHRRTGDGPGDRGAGPYSARSARLERRHPLT